ncbi:hypothetical protein, partial [Flavobacterium sp. UMI-01]|uniref:hypothetical protein n=1 Tax=Flavobacterium sp. UMI-01 TaxID=1441053 RepID=UPI001C7D6426
MKINILMKTRKSAHAIWKEAKEQNLTKEEFKKKLKNEGVIIPKNQLNMKEKIEATNAFKTLEPLAQRMVSKRANRIQIEDNIIQARNL